MCSDLVQRPQSVVLERWGTPPPFGLQEMVRLAGQMDADMVGPTPGQASLQAIMTTPRQAVGLPGMVLRSPAGWHWAAPATQHGCAGCKVPAGGSQGPACCQRLRGGLWSYTLPMPMFFSQRRPGATVWQHSRRVRAGPLAPRLSRIALGSYGEWHLCGRPGVQARRP